MAWSYADWGYRGILFTGKDLYVQRSLSVLLPVKDAQATLSDSVHEILDVVTDSSDHFELLIIDDGSTDATNEVAHELTRHYPQVRLIRHHAPLGREEAIRTGLKQSKGEIVLLGDKKHSFSILEQRPRQAKGVSSRPSKPNYLARLKQFAFGE
jgi:cellulose synthase/poly-beta-1,6-N-acetylglucosamine synthase-like glycosyltransferase